jgi:hypothetical protein
MKKPIHFGGLKLALFSASLSALAPMAGAQSFYGLSFFGNELISIDASGTGSLIGSTSENVTGYGLAYRGNQLFTFDPNADLLRTIDPATAALGTSFSIGVGDLIGEGDLAFRRDGMGFLASALSPDFTPTNDLFRFDITSGTSTRIGGTEVTLNGLAFVGDTLYGLGKEGMPSLYVVDQDTAALTAVGSLGIMAGSPFGALTSDKSGNLYGVIDDRLYFIDAASGAASMVDPEVLDLGFASISGLVVAPQAAAVPEPSTYTLAGGALLLGLAVRRKFGRKTGMARK